jgi:hypothetical protein
MKVTTKQDNDHSNGWHPHTTIITTVERSQIKIKVNGIGHCSHLYHHDVYYV